MLGGLALKRRWQRRRQAAGEPADKPNMVLGMNFRCAGRSLRSRLGLSAATQFRGTPYFNVGTLVATVHNLTVAQTDRHVWRPDAFGSVLFLVSSAFAILALEHGFLTGVPDRCLGASPGSTCSARSSSCCRRLRVSSSRARAGSSTSRQRIPGHSSVPRASWSPRDCCCPPGAQRSGRRPPQRELVSPISSYSASGLVSTARRTRRPRRRPRRT
jgi:hypothetical protein